MFTEKRLMLLYAITPVHMGSGTALGLVDNPIQREVHTGHPVFAGSGIKGAFRHMARIRWTNEQGGENKARIEAVFGPETDASERAGAVSFTDAQLIVFPVRSLKAGYAYATCPTALARLFRMAEVAGVPLPEDCTLPPVAEEEAFVASEELLVKEGEQDGALVLEVYRFQGRVDPVLQGIARWLAEKALPEGTAHGFFRDKLARDLVLLSDTQYAFFARNSTSVEPHVRINDATGTADDGGLFFTENLPPESVLVGLVMASDERQKRGSSGNRLTASQVIEHITGTFGDRIVQMGGDATTGRGQVLVRFAAGG